MSGPGKDKVTPKPKGGIRMGLRSQFTLLISLFTVILMVIVIQLLRQQQEQMLKKEIAERGLAVARTLAANCVEPMDLPERTLATMLLVKEVIQPPETIQSSRWLSEGAGPVSLMIDSVRGMFFTDTLTAAVRNEGVLFAKVVGADGKTVAVADAMKSATLWMDELDKPYQPSLGTQPLAAGSAELIMESGDRGGMYVVAVPIMKSLAGQAGELMLEEEEPAPAPAGEAATTAPAQPAGTYMGAVYLGISMGLLKRAIAIAVARLLVVAFLILIVGIIFSLWIAGVLVRPIHLLRDGVKAVAGGKYDHRVKVKSHDEIGDLAASFNHMTSGLAERDLIQNAFGAYVSKDVLADILNNPDAMKVGGARKTITMLCSDVRGFTAMSEKLQPEEVVAVINLYLDCEAKIVAENHGVLDRFVGDAVRAVFGIPMEKKDDALRAARCALQIKQAVARLVAERTAKGLPAPKVGIGLDSGHVVAGNLGAPGIKLDYTVIGNPVGTAERMVDSARDPNAVGAQIVMTENTYLLLKGQVETKELQPLPVPGRDQPIKVYELVGLKAV